MAAVPTQIRIDEELKFNVELPNYKADVLEAIEEKLLILFK